MGLTKTAELANADGRLNRARDDEPVFVLLGRDAAAAATVRQWVGIRLMMGKNRRNDPQIVEALAWADAADAYRKALDAPAPAPAPTVRTCNRHVDCDAADAAAKAAGKRVDHCHDDDCEDCFGR